jgi:hypothetical protein
MALGAGAQVGVTHWNETGGAINIDESLVYGKFLHQSAGAVLNIGGGDKLTLGGAPVLEGALNGSGSLVMRNALVVGLAVGGPLSVAVTGTVSQSGILTLGDGNAADAATVSIGSAATWRIGAGAIARGADTASHIVNAGLLTKFSGAGVSTVGVSVTDYGTIEAAVGTLDLTQALAGSGMLKIDASATLEIDGAAGATLKTLFNGAAATLALKAPKTFVSTIGGFAVGDTIDLLNLTATGASINANDQLVIVNGPLTVATLKLTGPYTGATLKVASDGHGGTDVTLLTATGATPHALANAIAGMGVSGPAACAPSARPVDAERALLLAPKSAGA